MKIKFADDRINEFLNGSFHVVNSGAPIEVVSADVAKDLLAATHLLDGEYVPVFVVAEVEAIDTTPLHTNEPNGEPDANADESTSAAPEATSPKPKRAGSQK